MLYTIRRVTVNSNEFSCNKVYAAEHLTVNQGVTGSSPVGGAILIGQKCNLCQKALFYKAFSVS